MKKLFKLCFGINKEALIFAPPKTMSHGVTGNTSDFGSEESRFET